MSHEEAVYQQCARAGVDVSTSLLERLLSASGTALGELARKAGRETVQRQYREQQERLSETAGAITGAFRERMEAKLTAFREGDTLSEQETLSAQPDELSREITRVVDCVTNHLAEPLWQLNMRLAILRGGRKTDDYGNPLGPSQFCGALCAVLAEQGMAPSSQMVVFRLLERHLPERLESFYGKLNGLLIKRDVFPNLRFHLAGSSDHPRSLFALDASEAAEQREKALQSLLNQWVRRQAGSRDERLTETGLGTPLGALDAEGKGGPDCLSDMEVAFALTAVQARFPVPEGRAHRPSLPLSEQDALVVEQLRSLGGGRKRLKRQHAEAMVRMGRLFHALVRAPYLTKTVRDLLTFLYLPFLKVSLVEHRFWTDPMHVGRQLLALFLELAEFWVTVDADRTVYPQLHAVAERLVNEYLDDSAVLDDGARELQAFAERIAHRANLTLNRTIEAERGMDRMGSAQAVAAEEVLALLNDSGVSLAASQRLQQPLSRFLSTVLLKEGSSDALAVAREVVGEISHSLQAAERLSSEQFTDMQPRVLDELKKALARLSTDAASVAALVKDVADVQASLSDGSLTDVAVDDASGGDEAAVSGGMPTCLAGLPDQGFGTWFVFPDGNDKPRLLTLVWSSQGGYYLFVNRLGVKGAALDRETLDAQMADETIRALPEYRGVLHATLTSLAE